MENAEKRKTRRDLISLSLELHLREACVPGNTLCPRWGSLLRHVWTHMCFADDSRSRACRMHFSCLSEYRLRSFFVDDYRSRGITDRTQEILFPLPFLLRWMFFRAICCFPWRQLSFSALHRFPRRRTCVMARESMLHKELSLLFSLFVSSSDS